MRWFRRGRDAQVMTEPTRPDPALPFFTEAEGARFRACVRATLAAQGCEVVIGPEHAVTADGLEWRLHSLAARACAAPRGEASWAGLVLGHFQVALAGLERAEAVS